MSLNLGLAMTCDNGLQQVCTEAAQSTDLAWHLTAEPADFFLNLHKNDYGLLLFDCCGRGDVDVKWVQFTRALRPRLPLLVRAIEDPAIESRLAESGVFYIFHEDTPSLKLFSEVIQSALSSVKVSA